MTVITDNNPLPIIGAPRDLQTILVQEGEDFTAYSSPAAVTLTAAQAQASPLNLGISFDNTTAVGGASLGGNGPGRMIWIENIIFGIIGLPAGTSVTFAIGGYGDADGKFPQLILRGVYSAGQGGMVIPVRRLFRPNRTNKSGLVATVRDVKPAVGSDTAIQATASIQGYELADDPNFNARETLLVVGDSLDYGKGYGPTATADISSFKVRDRYRALGHDLRIVSFSQPGRTSTQFEETDRKSGKLHPIRANLGLYGLGTNDVLLAAGGYVDTWETNFRAFWADWSKINPASPLVVRNVGPLNDNTANTNAAALRTRQASVVASIASTKCILADISTAFDRTNTSFFRASDQVHWNTAGHAAVYTAIDTALTAAGVYPSNNHR